MPLQVNINPEDINQYIGQAILDSTLGIELKKILDEKVRQIGVSWGSKDPLKKAIEIEVARVISEIVRSEPYQSMIRQKIQEALTDDLLSQVTSSAVKSFIEKIWEE